MAVQEFTLADVKNILVNRVGLPEDSVPEDPNVSFEDLGLDSLAFVEIQLAIQQDYGFTIPDEDAEKITTLGDAVEYSNSRLQEQQGE